MNPPNQGQNDARRSWQPTNAGGPLSNPMQPPPQAAAAPGAPTSMPLTSSALFLQGIVLCFLALVCVFLQVTGIFSLDPFLALGLSCLLCFFINPKRLFIPAVLFLPFGIINLLASHAILNGTYSVAYYFIGLSFGMLALAWVVQLKLGWVQPGALSPGLFVFLFGFVLLEAGLHGTLGALLYTLWLPAAVLGGLGISYLVMSAFRGKRA